MHHSQENRSRSSLAWYRVPDGTKVKPRGDMREGVIDGITEIVNDQQLNGDLKTQYRVRITGTAEVKLVGDLDLLFMVDQDGLVIIPKQAIAYRSHVTARLRTVFAADHFVS